MFAACDSPPCAPRAAPLPLPEEVAIYAPFLDEQIEIIEPKVIVPLGRHAMNYILRKYGLDPEPISAAHGRVYEAGGLFGNMTIVPMYHQAAAIYTRSLLDTIEEDFKILKKYYK